MGRLLLAGLLATSVLAAPIPKDETGRVARVYGATHDPDKGAEFRTVKGSLVVTTPPETRLFAALKGVHNAPRVWRDVSGSFVARVRVAFPIRSALPAKHADPVESRAGGGLVVWLDADNFLTVTRDERESDGKPGEFYRADCCVKGSTRGSADYAAPQRAGYVRVERWAKGLRCAYSADGERWKDLGSYQIDWGDTLKVGVLVENGFKAPFEATFDDYLLALTRE